MKHAKKKPTPDLPGEEVKMTTVEVARFACISYQTAYNRVLSGVYGPSDYDPKTRTMTVSARYVHRVVQRAKKKSRR